MTTHHMNLQEKYFNFIKNGTKRIELRLFDEKRQNIRVGDTIKFSTDAGDSQLVKVVKIHKYSNFSNLIDSFNIKLLAEEKYTKEKLLNELEQFYTKSKQAEYGVVGVEFIPIS